LLLQLEALQKTKSELMWLQVDSTGSSESELRMPSELLWRVVDQTTTMVPLLRLIVVVQKPGVEP
jgi:hypothetical protein